MCFYHQILRVLVFAKFLVQLLQQVISLATIFLWFAFMEIIQQFPSMRVQILDGLFFSIVLCGI